MGSDNYDDAAVFKLRDDLALVQTVDFFTPMVDDPYLFGQIAAANSLSDVYAMGGQPLTALNVAAFPACGDKTVFQQILAGGAAKVQEAGALLVGGHTVDDQEPKYGLSVTGLVHPQQLVTNAGGQEDDLLFLTKPLGTGVICSAFKVDEITEAEAKPIWQSMALLNKQAAELMVECGVRGATDITGFGLLGHLYELTQASGLAAELWTEFIPVWPLAEELAKKDYFPAGAYRNLNYLQEKVRFATKIPQYQRLLLADPQTSGGLLIAVPQEKAATFESKLESAGHDYAIIGKLRAGSSINVLSN